MQHPYYDVASNANDIALLILEEPVALNSYTSLACLPYKESTAYPSPSESLWISGWVKTPIYLCDFIFPITKHILF
jgi:hypothetical protein